MNINKLDILLRTASIRYVYIVYCDEKLNILYLYAPMLYVC